MTEAIEAGRFRPEMDDPQLVAQMLWSMVHGIATIYVAMPPEKQEFLALAGAEKTTRAACAAMLRGMQRTPT